MSARKPWTDAENVALAYLYFEMFDYAIAGRKYNKAYLIRIARELDCPLTHYPFAGNLTERSRGSIEAKLMNASACHVDILIRSGFASELNNVKARTMDGYGYRALSNYQKSLKTANKLPHTGTYVKEYSHLWEECGNLVQV